MTSAPSKFDAKTTAETALNNLKLDGKNVVITGCSAGIGVETARVLLSAGATVIMGNRNLEKTEKIKKELIEKLNFDENTAKQRIHCIQLDLSDLKTVQTFVETFNQQNFKQIHYLINNAGIMNLPEYTLSKHNVEMHFQVNHLSHWYLSLLLLPNLIAGKPARIINVSSAAHQRAPKNLAEMFKEMLANTQGPKKDDYDGMFGTYGVSKAANILNAMAFNDKFQSKGVTSVSLHPGIIQTELARHMKGFDVSKFANKTVPQGAATTIRCVSLSDSEIQGGGYYSDCQFANDSLRADVKGNKELANTLWELSQKLLTKAGFDVPKQDF